VSRLGGSMTMCSLQHVYTSAQSTTVSTNQIFIAGVKGNKVADRECSGTAAKK